MGRRRRFSRGGGGGGGRLANFTGFIGIVFGSVAMLIALITYGIGLSNLDTAYTTAATYTEQVGLTDIMGIWPLALFVFFMAIGISSLGAGAYVQTKRAMSGGWMDIFIGIITGTIAVVIAILMNTTIQGQLHTLYLAANNTTTNIANFSGLLSTMTIWGMVIFLSLMAAGLSPLVGVGIGAYRHVRGML